MDIIVCFDEKKMGYGDILFATKLAGLLRQLLINQGRLVGSVYLVCSEDNRGLSKFQNARADCEFGINLVLLNDMNALIKEGKVIPSVIIDPPAPMLSKIKFDTSNTTVIVSTGLLEELHEKGVILSSELCELGTKAHTALLANDGLAELDKLKQKFFNRLPLSLKNSLCGTQIKFAQYEANTNLTFGYGYSGCEDFLYIHQAFSSTGIKNEDVFLVSDNLNLKNWLQKSVPTLIENGFVKVIYIDVANGKELILYDSGQKGKTYRMLHAMNLHHPDVDSLYAISGRLSLATGDQSFMEAVQTNKIVCYDCLPHKELLYSAYQDAGTELSPKTRQALSALRLNKSIAKPSREYLTNLVILLKDPQVGAELSGLNQSIRNKPSLVESYLREIELVLPVITNPLDLAIISNTFDETMLNQVRYPHHLFLAIRYGRENILRMLLANRSDCLTEQDELGNNAFIIAAQHQQFELLSLLIQHAYQQNMSFSKIIHPNDHVLKYNILDYLPEYMKEDRSILLQLFGAYVSEAQDIMRDIENVSLVKVESNLVKEQNIWELLKQHSEDYKVKNMATLLPFDAFVLVAREYLRNKTQFKSSYNEVNSICIQLGYEDNWSFVHHCEYLKRIDAVYEYIDQSPLNSLIGTDWIPAIPPCG